MIAIVLTFTLGALLSILYWTIRNGISPMPTSPKVQKALLEALPKDFTGTIYELGSGWGTLARALAKKYPDSHITGFETSHIPYLCSKLFSLPNLTLLRKDFFQESLADADMIVCYLYPKAMDRLSKMQFKPGVLIVTHTFALPGFTPFRTIHINDLYRTPLYFYQIGGQALQSDNL